MSTTEPSKWSTALGASADVNTLPQTTPTGSGLASLSGLFPQITQIPLDSGGIAPERADFNALFKLLGDTVFFLMQGGVFSYLSTYAYTAGNLVAFSGAVYECIASNGPGNVHSPTDTAYWRQLALTSQLPTVNNGTLTIQQNGANVATFSANQEGNTTANISVPTVNNGTLTIQHNGANVATFRANQSGDTVANITVQASGPGAFDIGSTIFVGMGYDRYLDYGAIIPGGTERGWCPDDHGGALSGWINIPGTWVCCVGPGNNSNVRGAIIRRIA